jgi:hypothetical protein
MEIEWDRKEEASVLRSVRIAMLVHYKTACRLYDYYCALGDGPEATLLQSAGFRQFLKDFSIPDAESRGCTEQDCAALMKACSTDKASREGMRLYGAELKADLMTRVDWLEALMRLAAFKAMRDFDTDDLSLAVDLFFKETIHGRCVRAICAAAGSPPTHTQTLSERPRHTAFSYGNCEHHPLHARMGPKPPGRNPVSTVCELYNPPNSKNGTSWAQASKEGATAVSRGQYTHSRWPALYY